tara:strand:+ start:34 stop:426 length:393 start_codon:yes stop_codon:yes gene_type:complete
MNLANIKLPITIIGVILAQAFGIIWYVAQLDSTVRNLDTSVAEIKETQSDIDIAVLQTEVNSLKEELQNNKFDPSEIEDLIKGIDERVHIIETDIALIINDYKDILADHQLMMDKYDIKTSETYKNYGDK